jgi:hypothetical protein
MTHTSRSPFVQKILVGHSANDASSRVEIETMPPCCSLNQHRQSTNVALVTKRRKSCVTQTDWITLTLLCGLDNALGDDSVNNFGLPLAVKGTCGSCASQSSAVQPGISSGDGPIAC